MIAHTVDNFLDSYSDLREYANTAKFEDIENPVDGVTYPLICRDVPDETVSEIAITLSKIMGRMVKLEATFLRLSTEGVDVPHIAHTDKSMGDYSLMLYLNDNPKAGTSFLRHKETGMCYHPESEEFIKIARRDQNNVDAWRINSSVEMQQNRATIFDSGYFHCAQPVGGFGDDQLNGRIVLTCFFS